MAKGRPQPEGGNQHVAYFFLLLSDPVGFRDGEILTFDRTIGFDEWRELCLAGEHVPLDSTRLEVSVRFWQVTAPGLSNLDGDLEVLSSVATRALPSGQIVTASADNAAGGRPVTVVEVGVPLDEFDDDDSELAVLSDAFDRGLAQVQTIQRAVHIATNTPLALVTREALTPLIPFVVREVVDDPNGGWPDGLSLFITNANFGNTLREMTDAERRSFRAAVETLGVPRPFFAYKEFEREAHQAVEMRGDYRVAVVLAATAAEVLLEDLILTLLWEDCVPPTEAARILDSSDSVRKRVTRVFHPRIGGTWSLEAPGPIRDWFERVDRVRNRVVHGGDLVSLREARESVRTVRQLADYVAQRLVSPRVLAQYPRTTLMLLGRPHLEGRGVWTRRVAKTALDPNEVDWIATLARWSEVVRREGKRSERPAPNAAGSLVVAVVWPDGVVHWWVHDRRCNMVAPIDPPADLSATVRKALLSDRSVPEAVLVGEIQAPEVASKGWIHAYRALPLAGIMRDGSDLDGAHELWNSRSG